MKERVCGQCFCLFLEEGICGILWEPGVCGSHLVSLLVSDDRHVFDQSVISEVCMDRRNSDLMLCVPTLLSQIQEYHIIHSFHIAHRELHECLC